MSIDEPTLRKLGTDPIYAPPATFANACRDAADLINDLCKQIDGSVRMAAEALAENKRLRAALTQIKESSPTANHIAMAETGLKDIKP